MEFDKATQEFVLTGDDMRALSVPSELQRWPLRDVDHLFEEAALAERRIDELDAAIFPAGTSRNQIKDEQNRRRATLRELREVIAENALGDTDFEQLLNQSE